MASLKKDYFNDAPQLKNRIKYLYTQTEKLFYKISLYCCKPELYTFRDTSKREHVLRQLILKIYIYLNSALDEILYRRIVADIIPGDNKISPFKFCTGVPYIDDYQLVNQFTQFAGNDELYILSKEQQKQLIHIYIIWRNIDKQIVDFSCKCVDSDSSPKHMVAYSRVMVVLDKKNKILSNLSNEVERYASNILNSFIFFVIMNFRHRYWRCPDGKGYRRLKATNPLLSGTNRGTKKVIYAS